MLCLCSSSALAVACLRRRLVFSALCPACPARRTGRLPPQFPNPSGGAEGVQATGCFPNPHPAWRHLHSSAHQRCLITDWLVLESNQPRNLSRGTGTPLGSSPTGHGLLTNREQRIASITAFILKASGSRGPRPFPRKQLSPPSPLTRLWWLSLSSLPSLSNPSSSSLFLY